MHLSPARWPLGRWATHSLSKRVCAWAVYTSWQCDTTRTCCWAPAVQQLIDVCCQLGPQQQTDCSGLQQLNDGMNGQTVKQRMPDSIIGPALHTINIIMQRLTHRVTTHHSMEWCNQFSAVTINTTLNYRVIMPLVRNDWSAAFRHNHLPHFFHLGIRWHHVVIRKLILVTDS